MLTLGYGLKRPEDGDTGEAFFPALETNIQAQYDVLANTTSILAAAWGSDLGGGTYKQTITLPTAITSHSLFFDHLTLKVRDANGEVCHPRIDRQSTTTYDIYTNDNTAAFTVSHSV